MSNALWIFPDELPKHSHLDEIWFDRLDLNEAHRHHYTNLSIDEVNLVEAIRVLGHTYERSLTFQGGKTTPNLLRHIGEAVEQLVKPEKRRMVDFKSTLKTLEAYATYRQWVKKFTPNLIALPILEATIPYWLNPLAKPEEELHRGPGVLRVNVMIQNTRVAKLGEVRHDTVHIALMECRLVRPWSPSEDVDPVSLFAGHSDGTDVMRRGIMKNGLLNWMTSPIINALAGSGVDQPIVARERLRFNLDHQVGDRGGITLDNPSAAEVQALLDLVSRLAHQQSFPIRPRRQFRFEVANDLTAIAVSQIETEHWIPRPELPPSP